MVPFIALIVSWIVFRAAGYAGLSYFDDWFVSLQAAAVIMLLLSASAHWGTRRPDLIRMVPPAIPAKGAIVTVTGLLEIAGAIGLLIPAVSLAAAIALTTLLIAMFPANHYAAKRRLTIGGKPVPSLPVRAVLQLVFIAAILLPPTIL
ncbi:DoxX family protein [Paenibacillus protaetiae]|uniref:DoxX family membrane protein n=1 Tax=Paenibacillus protaetiae TaxID=2509456 RepID=A0A4P6EWD8_9BACL|nr:hypothetical protein [Paenibacillus protaetiae]QAY66503.1 hypothetical protein ET464_08850 [Paenibacillus protaetiae]